MTVVSQSCYIDAVGGHAADARIWVGTGLADDLLAGVAQGTAVVPQAKAGKTVLPQLPGQSQNGGVMVNPGMGNGLLILEAADGPGALQYQSPGLCCQLSVGFLHGAAIRGTGVVSPVVAAQVLFTEGSEFAIGDDFFGGEKGGGKSFRLGKVENFLVCHGVSPCIWSVRAAAAGSGR